MADVSEVDNTVLTPTDLSTTLSVTLDSSRSRSNNSRDRLDVTRDELQKRQLLHTVELLKLELSQKQLIIDTAQNEQANQMEELKERLADAQHEKKLLSLRVQSLSHGYEQELKRAREKLQKERARVEREGTAQRDSELELAGIREEVEAALGAGLLLKDTQYNSLKCTDPTSLTLKDFIRFRLYEFATPLQKQLQSLQQSIRMLNQQLASKNSECATSEQNLMRAEEKVKSLEAQCAHLTQEVKMVRTEVKEGNYKVDHFDAVKRERDSLRAEVERMQSQGLETEVKEKLNMVELDKLTKELSSLQQSVALLQQDKTYLTGQISELSRKLTTREETLQEVSAELNAAKREKEALYQQLIKAREVKHVECDRRLESELEGLRARTGQELNQLRIQTREVYERESRVLVESRDAALDERDKVKMALKALTEKYESLLKNYHSLQCSSDKRLAELQGEVQMLNYEKERTALVHQESVRDLKHLQLEQEKHRKKVEVLTQELWSMENSKEVQVKGLEGQLQDLKQRLQGYEEIEKELDDIVMQSAQMEDSCEAEKVLFSYGFGTSVPTQSKRRLQQSVQLARRVLHLEKVNASLRNQLKAEEVTMSALKKELATSQELLKSSDQPCGYLMNRVIEHSGQVQQGKEKIAQLEKELASVRKEKSLLVETKNQMAADMERLLNHREELHFMKAFLLGKDEKRKGPVSRVQAKTASSTLQPRPTVFTKQFQ